MPETTKQAENHKPTNTSRIVKNVVKTVKSFDRKILKNSVSESGENEI